MAAGDVYRIVVHSVLYGSSCVNVFHVRTTNDTTVGRPEDDVLERVEAQWIPPWMDVVAEDFMVDCIEAHRIHPQPGLVSSVLLDAGNTGQVIDDALPPNKCYCISWYSETYTKRGRGRSFFSGVPETWEDDNAIISDHAAILTTFAETIEDGLSGGAGGGQFELTIWSADVFTAHPVVDSNPSPQVRSIRKRTARRCA